MQPRKQWEGQAGGEFCILDGLSLRFRISAFQGLGFCLVAVTTTFVDARIPSHVRFGVRHYSLGYGICVLGIGLFASTYVLLGWLSSRWPKILIPASMPLLWAAIAQFNFMPECPHGAIWGNMLHYSLASIVALWAFAHPIRDDYVDDVAIPLEAKVQRANATISFWQSITISTALAYMALVISWYALMFSMTQQMVPKPAEQFIVNLGGGLHVAVFSVFVIVGPIYELLKKTERSMDVLLDLRSVQPISHPKREPAAANNDPGA